MEIQGTMYQIFTFKTRCNASTVEPG